jgi:hypothetical protein
MSRTVLFAGGPLHGQTRTVDDHVRTVAVPELCGNPFGDPATRAAADFQFRQVAYGLHRFAICGRIVWIGYSGADPDDSLVFEVLTSDGAKAASVSY